MKESDSSQRPMPASESVALDLPVALVAAARAALASHSPDRTGGSLDALVTRALEEWLRESAEVPPTTGPGGHTPDGWYD